MNSEIKHIFSQINNSIYFLKIVERKLIIMYANLFSDLISYYVFNLITNNQIVFKGRLDCCHIGLLSYMAIV